MWNDRSDSHVEILSKCYQLRMLIRYVRTAGSFMFQSISWIRALLLGGNGNPKTLPTFLSNHSSGTPSLMPSLLLTHLVYSGFGFSKKDSSSSSCDPPTAAAAANVSGFGGAPRAFDACGLSCKEALLEVVLVEETQTYQSI